MFTLITKSKIALVLIVSCLSILCFSRKVQGPRIQELLVFKMRASTLPYKRL